MVLFLGLVRAHAQFVERVADVPTRPGVLQRLLLVAPAAPKAAVVLYAGGHGGLQIAPSGTLAWGAGNFLVRTRQLFSAQGLLVAVIDAPSDQQSPPFLQGRRQRPEHAADAKAVIAWLRETAKVPVWLVGTSRGTQSVAYLATVLRGADGPDGIVLSATVATDPRGRPVPALALQNIGVPVLVVHHEQDACALCAFPEVQRMVRQFTAAPRSQLLAFTGGTSRGDPCEAFAHHGFNGIERQVIEQIAAWILAK